MTDREQQQQSDTVSEAEGDQPNSEGFAGDPSTPEPATDADEAHTYAEEAAIPAGDLTGPIAETLEGATGDDED